MSIFVCALRRLLIPRRPAGAFVGFSNQRSPSCYYLSVESNLNLIICEMALDWCDLNWLDRRTKSALRSAAHPAFRPGPINKNSVSACQLFFPGMRSVRAAERWVESLCFRLDKRKTPFLTFAWRRAATLLTVHLIPGGALLKPKSHSPLKPRVCTLFYLTVNFSFSDDRQHIEFLRGWTENLGQDADRKSSRDSIRRHIPHFGHHSNGGASHGRLPRHQGWTLEKGELHANILYICTTTIAQPSWLVINGTLPRNSVKWRERTRMHTPGSLSLSHNCALGMHARVLPRQVFQREPSWALINHLCAGGNFSGSSDGWNLNVDALDGARFCEFRPLEHLRRRAQPKSVIEILFVNTMLVHHAILKGFSHMIRAFAILNSQAKYKFAEIVDFDIFKVP